MRVSSRVAAVTVAIAVVASSYSGISTANARTHVSLRSGTPVSLSAVSGWTDVRANIAASAIAFDATRNKIIAAIPSSVAAYGNDIVEIDPSTGALGRSLFVGSSPSSVSLSADGTTAYVALSKSTRVVRVDLTTFTVASSFSIGTTGFLGPKYPVQVAIVPGDNNAVVVASHDTVSSFADFAVYDNGIVRPNHDAYPGTFVGTFTFGPDAATIYGYNSESTEYDLSTWHLDAQGLTLISDFSGLISGFQTSIKYASPYVFASSGEIVNPGTNQLVTTLPSSGDAVAPSPGTNRAYYIAATKLKEFRLDTFALVSSKNLQVTGSGGPTSLVQTTVGLAAVIGGELHLIGQGIGPAAAITQAALPDHVAGLNQISLNYPVAGMINDGLRHHLIASIPSFAFVHPNEVVELDPSTGVVGRHLYVGNDPDLLALSDDASQLYVGQARTNSVVQISLGSFQIVRQFSLGSDPFSGPFYAGSMVVQPGHPNTIAVTRVVSGFPVPDWGEITVYDSGVQRQNGIGVTPQYSDIIAFGQDPNVLYTVDRGTSTLPMTVMSLDAQGLHVVNSANDVGGAIAGVVGTTVYAACGTIDGNSLDPLGGFAGCIDALDVRNDRAYGFDANSGDLTEYQISTSRNVATFHSGLSLSGRLVPTDVGFATLDQFDGSMSLFVQQALHVPVSWSAADNARIQQLSTYLGQTPAQTQQTGVALLAFFTGLIQAPSLTPRTPTPVGSAATITSVWNTANLPLLRSVEWQYMTSDSDATRLSFYVLSFLLGLQGH